MKIEAAVLTRGGIERDFEAAAALTVREVSLDAPGPGEVLIRVAAAGVCHSDLSVINGTRPRPVPMVLGHEASGFVEQVGDGIDDLAPGDHVVCIFAPGCGTCLPCAEGRPALCTRAAKHHGVGELMTGHRRLSMDGAPVHHHVGVSAFASHAVLARQSLVKVDADVPPHISALFSCAMLTGAGAVFNTARVMPGSKVAVIGLGGVGLSAILGAAAAGAGEIIAIDPFETKMETAMSMGATRTIKADGDTVDAVREATGGGVDFAIELAGSTRALETAWGCTCRGGTTVTAGLPHPDARMSLNALQLVAEERSLRGSYIGSCVPQRDLPRMFSLYTQGKLPVEKMLTHRLKLADINRAMDQLDQGTAIRQVIEFG
ncbi:alcohol dehydrogenase [Salipiger aestuarii]|uniref:Alcohol dehydrogenase n=1 Tax=Salipiger aestuarii TaxID=568098 RepID=A0A327Y0R4_9RHOB|nr:zinc-binding dehydrogenase [Salipiger aestuarii]EIE49979.1 alcohol dehydrogenase [Citreicella sp. 357]KAA8605616.1 alcohol dehydrogenase [Salipiger aestuarii]KAA8608237.1 alcohol dehydrogenase [Salipiger aestuarii]KAB2539814.1 alcohol dehydrogenase [Salipiger aestuarii]RAK11999.1 alcohol dehydrogenase [Salipiger aestuarii]